ncbi:hypothetical protein BLNAU_3625 [Blattamonas nauphoetae]|uniref:Uncharacterized protein n=1 Tax=Blattamonas nauphoetae TaxID=2049346 RepID=A0ABQ9YCK4_9EUKA|nr:hypothetical protein BLNAU_3625 [Blattamonas nauphoetae]
MTFLELTLTLIHRKILNSQNHRNPPPILLQSRMLRGMINHSLLSKKWHTRFDIFCLRFWIHVIPLASRRHTSHSSLLLQLHSFSVLSSQSLFLAKRLTLSS